MNEVWHPVVGYEGLFEVSDQGRVRSVATQVKSKGGSFRSRPSRLLSPSQWRGYLRVTLFRDGVRKYTQVHQLVAAAFIGPCPVGQQVRHGVLGKAVNTPENLSYGTCWENHQDQIRDGSTQRGTKHHKSKLTDADVLEIYQLAQKPRQGSALARRFNVSTSSISAIKLGKSWSWLTEAG